MKNKSIPHTTVIAALTAAGLAFAPLASANEETIQTPQGSLKALQEMVVEGSHVDLDWKISYPVHNFNETDTEVTVRFITCAIGNGDIIRFGTRTDGAAYEEFYNGHSEGHPSYSITPETIVSKTFLSANHEIEFLTKYLGSRIRTSNGWVSSLNPAQRRQIIELHKGDAVPNVAPVPGQRSVADILAPYSQNGVMTIGKDQKIILFEVYTDDVRSSAFDLQDLILLVTYEQVDITE